MPREKARLVPQPPVRLHEVSFAVCALRLACRKAEKARISASDWETSEDPG